MTKALKLLKLSQARVAGQLNGYSHPCHRYHHLKTRRVWGAIHNYVRSRIELMNRPFRVSDFTPPLSPKQAKDALRQLVYKGEIGVVRHGRGHKPAIYHRKESL